MRTLIVFAAALFGTVTVNAQTFPPRDQQRGLEEASRPSVLHGTLLVHDELRQWLGIKLDRPACGQKEVELSDDRSVQVGRTRSAGAAT